MWMSMFHVNSEWRGMTVAQISHLYLQQDSTAEDTETTIFLPILPKTYNTVWVCNPHPWQSPSYFNPNNKGQRQIKYKKPKGRKHNFQVLFQMYKNLIQNPIDICNNANSQESRLGTLSNSTICCVAHSICLDKNDESKIKYHCFVRIFVFVFFQPSFMNTSNEP